MNPSATASSSSLYQGAEKQGSDINLASLAYSLESDIQNAQANNIVHKLYVLLDEGKKQAQENTSSAHFNPLLVMLHLSDVLLSQDAEVMNEKLLAYREHEADIHYLLAKTLHFYFELALNHYLENPKLVYNSLVERRKSCLKQLKSISEKSDTRLAYELDCIKECLNLLDTNVGLLSELLSALPKVATLKLGEVKDIIAGLYNKLSHSWYASVGLIRALTDLLLQYDSLAKEALDKARDNTILLKAQDFLKELQLLISKEALKNWHNAYAGVEALGNICKYAQCQEIRSQALQTQADTGAYSCLKDFADYSIDFGADANWRVRLIAGTTFLELLASEDQSLHSIEKELYQKILQKEREKSKEKKHQEVVNALEAFEKHPQQKSHWCSWRRYFPLKEAAVSQEMSFLKEKNLSRKIELLQQERLENQDITLELKTYVPVNGTYNFYDTNLFDVETEIRNFLKTDKKVLLMLGDAGSGKSTCGRFLERRLWQEIKDSELLPLFIELPVSKDPIRRVVETYLESKGFNVEEIVELKRTKKFLFFLDAYDELGKEKEDENLYDTNALNDWNAKVIISCRSQYLASKKENYQERFRPHLEQETRPQLLKEIILKPFTDAQIDTYLEKFIQVNRGRFQEENQPYWDDWKEYKKRIENLPGLKELIETPFVLSILSEVLPEISKRYENLKTEERSKLTLTDLYNTFVERWYDRQYNKLNKAGSLRIEGELWDIKKDFKFYSQILAKKMFLEGVSVVKYPVSQAKTFFQDTSEKQSNMWDGFFDFEKQPRLRLIFSGCPMRKINEDTEFIYFAFIHLSIQHHLLAQENYEQVMRKEAALPASKLSQPILAPQSAASSSLFSRPPSITSLRHNIFFKIHQYFVIKKDEKPQGYEKRWPDFIEILLLLKDDVDSNKLKRSIQQRNFKHSSPFKGNRYQELREELMAFSDRKLKECYKEYYAYLKTLIEEKSQPQNRSETISKEMAQDLLSRLNPSVSPSYSSSASTTLH